MWENNYLSAFLSGETDSIHFSAHLLYIVVVSLPFMDYEAKFSPWFGPLFLCWWPLVSSPYVSLVLEWCWIRVLRALCLWFSVTVMCNLPFFLLNLYCWLSILPSNWCCRYKPCICETILNIIFMTVIFILVN